MEHQHQAHPANNDVPLIVITDEPDSESTLTQQQLQSSSTFALPTSDHLVTPQELTNAEYLQSHPPPTQAQLKIDLWDWVPKPPPPGVSFEDWELGSGQGFLRQEQKELHQKYGHDLTLFLKDLDLPPAVTARIEAGLRNNARAFNIGGVMTGIGEELFGSSASYNVATYYDQDGQLMAGQAAQLSHGFDATLGDDIRTARADADSTSTLMLPSSTETEIPIDPQLLGELPFDQQSVAEQPAPYPLRYMSPEEALSSPLSNVDNSLFSNQEGDTTMFEPEPDPEAELDHIGIRWDGTIDTWPTVIRQIGSQNSTGHTGEQLMGFNQFPVNFEKGPDGALEDLNVFNNAGGHSWTHVPETLQADPDYARFKEAEKNNTDSGRSVPSEYSPQPQVGMFRATPLPTRQRLLSASTPLRATDDGLQQSYPSRAPDMIAPMGSPELGVANIDPQLLAQSPQMEMMQESMTGMMVPRTAQFATNPYQQMQAIQGGSATQPSTPVRMNRYGFHPASPAQTSLPGHMHQGALVYDPPQFPAAPAQSPQPVHGTAQAALQQQRGSQASGNAMFPPSYHHHEQPVHSAQPMQMFNAPPQQGHPQYGNGFQGQTPHSNQFQDHMSYSHPQHRANFPNLPTPGRPPEDPAPTMQDPLLPSGPPTAAYLLAGAGALPYRKSGSTWGHQRITTYHAIQHQANIRCLPPHLIPNPTDDEVKHYFHWHTTDDPLAAQKDPLATFAPPPTVDLRLLGNIRITATELLAFFPNHTGWRDYTFRLRQNGWSNKSIAGYINYTRQLDSINTPGSSSGSDGAKKMGAIQLATREADAVILGFKGTKDAKMIRPTWKWTGFTCKNWIPNPREKGFIGDLVDYYLIDLADGLVHFPTGSGARILTRAVKFCVENKDELKWVRLSQVRELVKLNPGIVDGLKPMAFWGRDATGQNPDWTCFQEVKGVIEADLKRVGHIGSNGQKPGERRVVRNRGPRGGVGSGVGGGMG